MANITNQNPLILDTAGATNLGQVSPFAVYKIVWEGTTIAAGNQAVIVSGDDGTSVLWEHTASNNEAPGSSTNQRIEENLIPPRILPAKGAGGWKLGTLSAGKLYIYSK
jgi:hypothetical protein